MRINMWSGPRNLSTAMMYAFAARVDCAVSDEPFYGAYLKATGLDHPMAGEIVAAMEPDPEKVAAYCRGPVPEGRAHWYQKHMPHHMVPGFPMCWAEGAVQVHLIRHPARVVASYAAKREAPTLDDIGFRQQADLYDRIGGVVIDSADIRANPEVMLRRLCDAIGLSFDPAMLSWPEGGHPADGIWAKHWYGVVHRSTGFAGPEGALPVLSGDYAALAATALPYYEKLAEKKL